MSPVRLGVIGLGLVGGSIVQRLAVLGGGEFDLVGFDVDEETRNAAAVTGIEMAESARAVADATELVVVAVPPQQAGATVIEALRANPHALVTDVASVKAPVLATVTQRSPRDLDRYLPSHPLSGAESAGWAAARADLLAGTVWAVCRPRAAAPAELLCRWADVFERFEARLVVCDPVEHDLAVARTSHAPHLAAEVIAAALDGAWAKLAGALSGGAFRDMTRIARSHPRLWREILELNRDEVVAVLEEWLYELERLCAALRDGDGQPLDEAWERGGKVLDLVERLRWAEPDWQRRSFEWPAWQELLALGREGVALRRLELVDGKLSAEVSTPPE